MDTYFEKVSKYADIDLPMPARATKNSAGYDLAAAADVVIPPYAFLCDKIQQDFAEKDRHEDYFGFIDPIDLEEMANATKALDAKVTLVSTGMKCHLKPNQYLELTVRSSTPLKHWIIMANGQGIIDADYCDNASNEGEIFLQLINLSPFAIKIHKGDKIGQGIIHTYSITDNDETNGERTGGFGSTSA